ncbi:polysaccharide biosynthesis tyrosine autokinase [Iodobacter sp. LRB]|uniref:polysaccharide biosynthesis tyrosine autokinase n=1 Tax=unclassified Iodobacter TaxID=235634 RepID=UPI000C0EB636|nr:polysaccharide biosynthesis tyrosine autokinase [Iodobacter sp. BJB302]PHV01452.1 chain length determinant protein tyrosine kinase EpsG [Iodobacter sp. BJB302]
MMAAQIEKTNSNSNIGKLLLDNGKLDSTQAEKVLLLQKEEGIRFGEAAIRLGYISEADIQQVLALQFSYPYLQKGQSKLSPSLVAAYDPFDKIVEEVRCLRSQILLRWISLGHKSVLLASCGEVAGELIANLAIVFSQLGEKTLLVDANLRQPHQHDLFGLQNRQGFSEVLAGRVSIKAAIQHVDGLLDLSVLTAGTKAPNPQELLSKGDMGEFTAELESIYDVILYDAPPSAKAADVQLLAARTKGVILVAVRHKTSLKDLAQLRDQCEMAGAEVLGCVLLGS